MEVAQQAQVPDGWEVVTKATPPPAPAGTGTERTRPDTSIIGVDHEKLQQSIANWASTLSPKWQKPAAMLATFPADVLASLAEMFSSPESVAGMAAPKAVPALTAAAEKISAARQTLAKPADLALDALMKRGGLEPEAIDLATTRLRLAAARSRTRQGRIAADVAAQPAAATTGASPSATPAAAASPASPPTTAPPAVPPELGKILKQLLAKGLSKEEVNEALKLLKRGMEGQAVWDHLQAARALRQSGTFGKLPTADEMQQAIAERNRTGKWPE